MTYEIRFHPAVRADLEAIARLIARAAGRAAAERRLAEIEAAVRSLAVTPHKGTIRDAIAPRLRAIPAGRRGVVAFTVDDDARSRARARDHLGRRRLDRPDAPPPPGVRR